MPCPPLSLVDIYTHTMAISLLTFTLLHLTYSGRLRAQHLLSSNKHLRVAHPLVPLASHGLFGGPKPKPKPPRLVALFLCSLVNSVTLRKPCTNT